MGWNLVASLGHCLMDYLDWKGFKPKIVAWTQSLEPHLGRMHYSRQCRTIKYLKRIEKCHVAKASFIGNLTRPWGVGYLMPPRWTRGFMKPKIHGQLIVLACEVRWVRHPCFCNKQCAWNWEQNHLLVVCQCGKLVAWGLSLVGFLSLGSGYFYVHVWRIRGVLLPSKWVSFPWFLIHLVLILALCKK